ncbi:glycosyltransferase [Flavobacterium okayamense]|uniref:Glycosyl transferase family 1 domain-containing protein n=1 Tax=Flavobacterium okayamense TaxID=2830782 RepID=A0ABM7S2P7_9FLAO|nr:glycosyltransferase [Flavobacterium okayamense]BCY27834.1 hypothetical protein KK2020170_07020 [Flavobacterium okayamense]
MKKIYHISENVSFNSGGVRTILLLLNNYLNQNHQPSNIITNLKEETDNFIHFETTKPWFYQKEIKKYLSKLHNTSSTFHLHGTYSYTQFVSSEIAIKNKIPYVLSPHGMLEPRVLAKNSLKKKLYLQLILNKIIKNAEFLHCITPIEKDNVYKLTQHKNIVEIPNLIDFSTIPKDLNYEPKEDYFLFIGRPDKIKGLELLIYAFAEINNRDRKLKIVGPENDYTIVLKQLVTKLGLDSNVEFLGPIFNQEKYNLITNARAVVVPSYSEVIGMVNLEASACKAPVITTHQTGLKQEFGKMGGTLINPKIEEIKNALQESLNWNDIERIERGNLLQKFVYENYSWDQKGKLWLDLYNKINL